MKKFVIFMMMVCIMMTSVFTTIAETVIVDQETLNEFIRVAYGESQKMEDGTFIHNEAVYTITAYGGMDSDRIFGFEYGFSGDDSDLRRLEKRMKVYAKSEEDIEIEEISIHLVIKDTEYTEENMYLVYMKTDKSIIKNHEDAEYYEYYILTRIY